MADALRIKAALQGNLQKMMAQEVQDATEGIVLGVRKATNAQKLFLRQQVINAGLGRKLSKTWRSRFYPNRRLDAAGLVYSKAAQIMQAFDEGVTIQAKNSKYLAIPTPAIKGKKFGSRRGRGGRFRSNKITPTNWPEKRFGALRFIPNQNGKGGVLVAEKQLKTKTKRFVAFVLVPQVKLRKRLDIRRAERRGMRLLPKLIQKHYQTTPVKKP